MCGRFKMRTETEKLRRRFKLEVPDWARPRYNIAPGQEALAVRETGSGREFAALRWGLLPGWVKDRKTFPAPINARIETIREKPSFRSAIKKGRCLIPTDGWYEWKAKDRVDPYLIQRADGGPFSFAAIMESWESPDGEIVETFAILTTAAQPSLVDLHERMPVILPEELYDAWLDPKVEFDLEKLKDAVPDLEAVAVGTRVNKVANDDEGCVEPRETGTKQATLWEE